MFSWVNFVWQLALHLRVCLECGDSTYYCAAGIRYEVSVGYYSTGGTPTTMTGQAGLHMRGAMHLLPIRPFETCLVLWPLLRHSELARALLSV